MSWQSRLGNTRVYGADRFLRSTSEVIFPKPHSQPMLLGPWENPPLTGTLPSRFSNFFFFSGSNDLTGYTLRLTIFSLDSR